MDTSAYDSTHADIRRSTIRSCSGARDRYGIPKELALCVVAPVLDALARKNRVDARKSRSAGEHRRQEYGSDQKLMIDVKVKLIEVLHIGQTQEIYVDTSERGGLARQPPAGIAHHPPPVRVAVREKRDIAAPILVPQEV